MEEFDLNKKKKKFVSIENSMASGVDSIVSGVIDNSLKLSKSDRIAFGMLINEPFLGDYVKQQLELMKHEKGWLTKVLMKMWLPFTKAFQTIYINKRVQRALKKANYSNNNW